VRYPISAVIPEAEAALPANENLVGDRAVVMFGPSMEARGGMAAVARTWAESGFFARWRVTYIPTFRESGKVAKFGLALRAFARLAMLLAQRRAALVHVHAASGMSFWRKAPLIALAHLARAPVVLQIHGGKFCEFYARECNALQRWAVRELINRASRVLALSEFWRKQYGAFCEPRRIAVTPNFVLAPSKDPSSARVPQQMLFLGQLSAAKGLRELLQALALLRGQFPALRLVCAGDGDLGQMRNWAEEFSVADAVDWLGWIGSDQKWSLLRTSSIFVLPSHSEAMPVALLEAMTAGTPSVATRVGSVPEILNHEVNGLLVEPKDVSGLADACRRLLSEPDRARQMGDQARLIAEQCYSPQRCLHLLDNIYTEVLLATA
jgi:glycosyltransferase involved in cell wall biosynthesis